MVSVADTAYSIAVVRAEEAERAPADRLFADPFASIFRDAGAHAREATERYLELPFFRDCVRLRTRGIDDFVRDGVASGLDQVVLLGAGFDCRGLRMPEITARPADVFEVDFAEQLAKKRDLLAAAGVSVPEHVRHVACDFARPAFAGELLAALAARGFRRGAATLFVWEGVAGYLDDASIDRSLAFMVHAGGPGTRVVFDYGASRFEPEPADAHVLRAGFRQFESRGFEDLWRLHLSGEPPANAWVCRLGFGRV